MGWQTLTFATPVEVSKNAEYVASYRTTVGKYSYTPGQFGSTDLSRGPLRVASDSGAYTYGTGFPGATVSTNYLVDVVFERNAAALTVAQRRPGGRRDERRSRHHRRPLGVGAAGSRAPRCR